MASKEINKQKEIVKSGEKAVLKEIESQVVGRFETKRDEEMFQKAVKTVAEKVQRGEILGENYNDSDSKKINNQNMGAPEKPDTYQRPDFLEKILSQKDKSVLARVATIIDTHTNVRNGEEDYISGYRDPFFWRDTVNEFRQNNGRSTLFDISEEDRNSYQASHVSRYYRTQGMYIKEGSQQYEALKEVMDYIRNDKNSSQNIQKVIDAQRTAMEHDKLLEQANSRSVGENESGKDIIMFAGKKYRLREKHRALYEMDTIEELYVKAVAVSIMAETDGRSDTAKEILENGGMDVVKNLETESVADLLVDLQILALEGEEEQINFSRNNDDGGMSR